MKIKKKIPLIDQANKLGFWGGKFGGNYVPETLKKPIYWFFQRFWNVVSSKLSTPKTKFVCLIN